MRRDHPPQSLGSLQMLGMCSESALLQTTFFHLIRKFDLSISLRQSVGFLLHSLARTLRYCPICLADYSLYSLTWRFLDLRGCPKHGCLLLDRCGHCGRSIPLLASPLQIGICPACRGDLRLCTPEALPEAVAQQNQAFAQDLEYLLLSQTFETSVQSLAEKLGRELTFLRREKHLSFVNVIERAGIPERALSAMAQGKSGVTFHWYLKLVRLLDVNFRDLFRMVLQRQVGERGSELPAANCPLEEERILEQIRETVMNLKSLQFVVTPKAISNALRIPLPRLRRYTQVEKLFDQLTHEAEHNYQEQAALRERLFTERVREAIHNLEDSGRLVTYKSIGEMIGIHPQTLKFYPQIKVLLKQRTSQSTQRRRHGREEDLLEQVERAIHQLKSSGQMITPKAVGKAVGLSTTTLKTYKRIRVILEQLGEDYPLHHAEQALEREKCLFEKAEEALFSLEEQKVPVTKRAVAHLIGIHEESIRRYPRVKTLIEEHTKTSSRMQGVYQREENFLTRVKSAVNQLREQGQPVTYTAIARILGVRIEACRRYPKVRAFLQEQIDQTSPPSSLTKGKPLSSMSEEALIMQVEKAIQQLTTGGRLITSKAIGQIVGVSHRQFVSYPHVYALIGKHVEESTRQYRLRQKHQKEEDLLHKVEAALQTLREQESVITRKAIADYIGIRADALNRYPCVKALLEQSVERYTHLQVRQAQQREQEVMGRIEEAARLLAARGLRVTQKAIGELVGEDLYALKNRYPLLRQLLEQITERYQHSIVESSLPEEGELLQRVILARDELDALGQRVTREAIAELVGLPRPFLRRFPRIEALLSKQRERESQRREEEVLAQVEMAIQRLEEHEQAVTHRSIAKEVGLTPSTLHYYPRAISLVQRIVKEKKHSAAIQRFQAREQELLLEVSNALQQLQQLGRPIFASSVARIVGVDISVLTYYPEVKRLVESAVQDYKRNNRIKGQPRGR